MQEIMGYLSTHWYGILMVLGAAITLGQAVVKLTPTKKDDSFMMRVAKIFDKLTGFIPNLKKRDTGLLDSLVKPETHKKKDESE